MTHYDAVLGAPDPQERKIALDKLVAELTEPLGFDQHFQTADIVGDRKEYILMAEAYQAGRNYQREADAQIAERNHRSLEWANEIAKAIRNQGDSLEK